MIENYDYIFDKLFALEVSSHLYKKAGFVEEHLMPLGEAIKSSVASNIDFSSTGSTIKTVLEFLAPAMLFRVHPLLGILNEVARLFGFDLVALLGAAVSRLTPAILSGNVLPEQINQAIGINSQSVAAMEYLQTIEKRGRLNIFVSSEIVKEGSASTISMISKLFRSMSLKGISVSGFLASVIGWIFRTVLLSAGLMGGAGAVRHAVAPLLPQAVQPEAPMGISIIHPPAGLNPVGGNEIPSSGNYLYFDVPNGSLEDMLLSWVREIYPKLSEYEDIIIGDSGFRRVLSEFHRRYDGGRKFRMPLGTTRQNILNQFVGNVWQRVKNEQ